MNLERWTQAAREALAQAQVLAREMKRMFRKNALTKLAAYETSANGRHYYLVCAHELENRH